MEGMKYIKRKNIKSKSRLNCLRRYRRARGLKQKEVAEILGLRSASMVSRWEKGVCMPNTANLFKLAVLYRTMADALFIDLVRELRDDLLRREESVLALKPRVSDRPKSQKAQCP